MRFVTTIIVAVIAAFSVAHASRVPLTRTDGFSTSIGARLSNHAIIGFSVDSAERAATAAQQGVTTTILYGGSPAPRSTLEKALSAYNITIIDASVSGWMYYWECHRTHTVAPPPKGYSNDYCATDYDPHITEAVVLQNVDHILKKNATRPYVVGYWVLDDWAWWDPGSGRGLLQKVHGLIVQEARGLPAICGFGGAVLRRGQVGWDPGTAKNYSNGGCDIVGWYNYSPFGRRHPSNGKQLDWTMSALLPAMQRSLEQEGWEIAHTPLYGIGQAWGGSYENRYYQPGLTRGEMLQQARAFCQFGAQYIGWYAWDDSGFEARTETPNNSAIIGAGIAAGIKACRAVWNRDVTP